MAFPAIPFLQNIRTWDFCDWHFSSEMGGLAVEFRLVGRKDKAVDMT